LMRVSHMFRHGSSGCNRERPTSGIAPDRLCRGST
jgi:hypothetical protein